MTRKEVIKNLIKRGVTSYTPHHFDLTMKITDMLGNYYGYDRNEVEDKIGNHFLYVDYTAPDDKNSGYHGNTGEESLIADEFGVVWDMGKIYEVGDWGMVENPINNMDFSDYSFPSGRGRSRFNKAAKLMEIYSDRFNVLRMTGLFDLSWHIVGLDSMLMYMALDEKTINELLDKTTEYMVNIISQVPEQVDA